MNQVRIIATLLLTCNGEWFTTRYTARQRPPRRQQHANRQRIHRRTFCVAALGSCAERGAEPESTAPTVAPNTATQQNPPVMNDSANPFFAASDLQFQYPPFDRIDDQHYLPAFEAGMDEQLAEVEAIATSTQPPSVENTISRARALRAVANASRSSLLFALVCAHQ